MQYPWYARRSAADATTQGDILIGCPVASWDESGVTIGPPEPAATDLQRLEALRVTYRINAVVMSQACDLEHRHLPDAVICAVEPMDEYRQRWGAAMAARGQALTDRAWQRERREIIEGRKFHLAALGQPPMHLQDVLVVDFRRVYSVPIEFLESWLRTQGERSTLLPPYREHLSQAFARFFMRVGLPTSI